MGIFTVVTIAFALAMDAFAASMASGAVIKKNKLRKAFAFGFMFGAFQMFMPVLGWAVGMAFRDFMARADHWIAFGLLFTIGCKMFYEALKMDDIEGAEPDMTFLVLFGLAIATSIDALAVGIGFAFLEVSIFLPVMVIGFITFLMSVLGVFLGSKAGDMFGRKVEMAGGLILIAIGFKILLEHLAR
ncbi:MAG: manganese efflux pump MntP family protein [Candidatus Omnitrophota bacterium]